MTPIGKMLLLASMAALSAGLLFLVAGPFVASNSPSAGASSAGSDFDQKAFDETLAAFSDFNKIEDEWLDAYSRRDLAAMLDATRRQTAALCRAPYVMGAGWYDANCGAAP